MHMHMQFAIIGVFGTFVATVAAKPIPAGSPELSAVIQLQRWHLRFYTKPNCAGDVVFHDYSDDDVLCQDVPPKVNSVSFMVPAGLFEDGEPKYHAFLMDAPATATCGPNPVLWDSDLFAEKKMEPGKPLCLQTQGSHWNSYRVMEKPCTGGCKKVLKIFALETQGH